MEVVITQPVFAWVFGIVSFLLIIILIAFAIILFELNRLLKFVNIKANDVAGTIDEVRNTVHKIIESVDSTREHIASFVAAATNAASIARIVATIKGAWSKHHDDLFDEGKKHKK